MTDALLTPGHFTVAAVTLTLVVACVLLHYEVSTALSRFMRKASPTRRRRFLVLMFGLLGAHVIEIWLFGLAAGLLDTPDTGRIVGSEMSNVFDYVYLSAITYTTLGYGDVFPEGPIRFLMGTEALTGFMLITWSASLTFLEMQRHWDDRR